MSGEQINNPLHGITLKMILEALVENHGWEGLAATVNIACFKKDPSLKSSLKFLRKTPWARAKVEAMYLNDLARVARKKKRNKKRAERRAKKAEAERLADEGSSADNGQEPSDSTD